MSKYDALKRYLQQRGEQQLSMTFAEIEQIIGQPLPPSARRHRAWWSNNPSNNVMTHAWLQAGYRATQVDFAAERLMFVRVAKVEAAPTTAAQAAPPLHGFLKGALRLPPEEELLQPAPAQWQTEDNPLPERRPDAC